MPALGTSHSLYDGPEVHTPMIVDGFWGCEVWKQAALDASGITSWRGRLTRQRRENVLAAFIRYQGYAGIRTSIANDWAPYHGLLMYSRRLTEFKSVAEVKQLIGDDGDVLVDRLLYEDTPVETAVYVRRPLSRNSDMEAFLSTFTRRTRGSD